MKNKVLLIAFLLLLLIPIKANAIGICPAKQLSKYTTEAYNVKSSYELFKTESEEARFRITFTNVSNNLKIRYNGRDYYGTKESKVAISTTFEPNKEYQFEVYSNDNMQICGNAFLVTKKVKTPYYNKYSELDECIEYEEFPLCGQYYDGKIESYDDFQWKLEDYKKSMESETEKFSDERTFIQRIVDWCSDNIEITVAIISVIVLIILAIIARIIYKKVKRTKIKL